MTSKTAAASDPGDGRYRPDRQIVVYENGRLLAQESGWYRSDGLRQYAAAHVSRGNGNFIPFQDGRGPIHEIAERMAVAGVQATYAPLKILSEQQNALADQQEPLAVEQHALAAQMKAAVTPAQMAEVGREQGRIGRLQGELGQQQGRIGQQQGAIGRAFYAQLQSLTDACLRDGSCPAIEGARPAS